MRLLYVLDRFPVPSETFVVNEIRGLLTAGDDLTVYARRGGERGIADDLLELVIGPGSVPRARGIGMALRMRERGAFNALAEATWLARQTRAERVHAHFAFGNATVALLYGRLADVPASFTTHGLDLYAGVRRSVLGRKVAASAFAAAVSKHGVDVLRACAAPVDRDKVVLLRNGVARSLEASTPESPPRIVAIARQVEKKGLDVLVRAAQALSAETVVELVGDGPERPRLEALARDSGARVRFSGTLSHEQALSRLVGATAFALPCRRLPSGDHDQLPVALVEAMSTGVPVVSTPVGGIPELVREGETGLLVPEDDPAALAAALNRLLTERPLRERLSVAGRAATEPWRPDRCIAALRQQFS